VGRGAEPSAVLEGMSEVEKDPLIKNGESKHHQQQQQQQQQAIGDLEAKIRSGLAQAAPYFYAYAVVIGVLFIGWTTCYAIGIKLYVDHRNDHCDERLAPWLLVDAVVGLVTWSVVVALFAVLWSALRLLANAQGNDDEAVKQAFPSFVVLLCFLCLILLGSVFLVCWKIYGSVIVYSMDTPVSAARCPAALYHFTWTIILVGWIMFAVLMVSQCVVMFVPCGGAAAIQPTHPEANKRN